MKLAFFNYEVHLSIKPREKRYMVVTRLEGLHEIHLDHCMTLGKAKRLARKIAKANALFRDCRVTTRVIDLRSDEPSLQLYEVRAFPKRIVNLTIFKD